MGIPQFLLVDLRPLPTMVALLSLKYSCEMLTSVLYLLIKMMALEEI